LPAETMGKLDQMQQSYQELLHDRLIEEIVDDVSLDTPIYRIDTLEHFEDALQTKELFLANPCCWDDAWEDYILRGHAFLRDGTKIDISAMKDSFFAQCWSLTPNCEGLWKVRYFDPKNMGSAEGGSEDSIHNRGRLVRIQTTIRSLMREVYKVSNEKGHAQFRVGLVRYEKMETIRDMHAKSFKDPSLTSQIEDVIRSLLTKRLDFEYEKELRLIYREEFMEKGAVPVVRKGVRLHDIDFHHYLKGIEIDPWCQNAEFEKIRHKLEEQYGIYCVSKSRLFDDEHIPTIVFGDDCLILTPTRIIPPKGK